MSASLGLGSGVSSGGLGGPQDRPGFGRFRVVVAVLVGALAGAVLVGWLLDVPRLTRVVPSFAAMVPNTALCLAFFAAAVVLQGRRRLVVLAPPVLVSLTVLLTYALHGSLDVAPPLLDAAVSAILGRPLDGRMAVITGILVLLLALGLGWWGRWTSQVAEASGLLGLFLTGTAILGYVYDVGGLYSFGGYLSLALHTAIALQLVSLVVLARSSQGVVELLVRDRDAGGRTFRLMAPVIVLVIPLLALAEFRATEAGWWDVQFGTVAVVATGMVVMTLATRAITIRLSAVDAARERALRALGALNLELEERVRARAEELESERRHAAVLEDRHRIAADLHDRVIQGLFASGMGLSGLLETWDADGSPGPKESQRALVSNVVDTLDQAVRDLRSSIFDLTRTTAGDALRALLQRIVDLSPDRGPGLELTIDGDLDRLTPVETEQIAAAAREAVSNAVRHARAERIVVALHVSAHAAHLEVSDDGVGLDPSTPSTSGLLNLRRRAEARAGACLWGPTYPDRVDRQGTSVSWSIRLGVEPEGSSPGARRSEEPAQAWLMRTAVACADTIGRGGVDVVHRVLRVIADGLQAENATLVGAAGRARVQLVEVVGPMAAMIQAGASMPRSASMAGYVMDTRRGIRLDSFADLRVPRRLFADMPKGPAVIVPVIGASGEAQGSLLLTRPVGSPTFAQVEVEGLTLLATYVGIARRDGLGSGA